MNTGPIETTPYESALRLRVGWGRLHPLEGETGASPRRRRTFRPHGTVDWHLLVVFEGRFILNPEADEPVTMPPGSAALFAPHQRQDYMLREQDHRGRFFWAHFFLEGAIMDLLDWPLIQNGQGLLRWDAEEPLHRRILDAATRCDHYYRSGYVRRRSLALLALEEILRLVNQVNPNRRVDILDDRVALGLSFISSHIRQPLSLEAIAAEVGLSSSRFAHVFSRNMRCGPMEYVEGLRIKMATDLLAETSLPIAEIALKSGFGSSSYFSRRFHKIKGLTPTAWRKRAANPPG